MVDDQLRRAVAALGRDLSIHGASLAGSASGAGVYRVRDGARDAVLKLDVGVHARRELAFYRTLAGRVPVGTPRLLDFAADDDLTVLLLSAHAPARPAREWDRSAWLEAVRELAELHAIPPPAQPPWLHTPWLRQVLDRPPMEVAQDYWSRTDAAGAVEAVLGSTGALATALDELSPCFIHGDFHVGNLLRDGDRFLWTDWQVAGIGNPAIDIAFLWHRAHTDGADIPYQEMLQAYAARRSIDLDVLRHAVVAAELGFLLFGFPSFAGLRTEDERDHVTRRLLRLLADW